MWLFFSTLIFPFLSIILFTTFTCCKKKQKSKKKLIKNKMSQLDYPQYPILKKEEDSTLVCTLSKTVNTAKTSGVSTAEVLSPSSEIQTTALTQENISVVSDKLEIVLNNSEKATITDGKSEKTISDLIGEKKSLTFSY